MPTMRGKGASGVLKPRVVIFVPYKVLGHPHTCGAPCGHQGFVPSDPDAFGFPAWPSSPSHPALSLGQVPEALGCPGLSLPLPASPPCPPALAMSTNSGPECRPGHCQRPSWLLGVWQQLPRITLDTMVPGQTGSNVQLNSHSAISKLLGQSLGEVLPAVSVVCWKRSGSGL